MSIASGRFLRSYGLFVGGAAVSAGAIAGVGYLPTVRLAGGEAAGAMVVGCGVSWVASCVGAVPVARAMSGPSAQPALAILASTVLRFLTVLALVAPLTLSGWLDRRVLVLWVAVSYVLLLLLDTAFALHVMKRAGKVDS